MTDKCSGCQEVIRDSDERTVCRKCKASFHLSCSGATKVSSYYGCASCYEVPGNAPQRKRVADVMPESHANTDPVNPAVSSADCQRVVEMLAKLLKGSSPSRSHSASDKHSPGCGSSSDNDELNVTTARTSSEFKRCLAESHRSHKDHREAVQFVKEAPPLPKFSGNVKDWPRFIVNYTESTKEFNVSDVSNMARLRTALSGKAWESVSDMLLHSSSLSEVLDSLRISYGDPSDIFRGLEEEARAVPRLDNNGRGLQMLSMRTSSLVTTLVACGMTSELQSCSLVNVLQQKLNFGLGLRWGEYKGDRPATLSMFSDFLKRELGFALRGGQDQVRMSGNTTSVLTMQVSHDDDSPPGDAPRAAKDPVGPPREQLPLKPDERDGAVPGSCADCHGDHRLSDCDKFKARNDEERRRILWEGEKRVCVKCLRTFHHGHFCRPKSCPVLGCPFKHHRLAHGACSLHFAHTNSTTINLQPDSTSLYKIVPIRLRNGAITVQSYAFIDEGSGVSLMDDSLAVELGLDGPIKPLTIKWTQKEYSQQQDHSRVVSVRLDGVEGFQSLPNIRTWEGLELPRQSLKQEVIDVCFPQGGGPTPYEHVQPRMLIGLPHAHLAAPREVRVAEGNLVAARTAMGWHIYGGVQRESQAPLTLLCRECPSSETQTLTDLLSSFLTTDGFGVRPAPHQMSASDRRAIQILGDTVKMVGDRYEAGLLWRDESINVPQTRKMCESRAIGLQRRLASDSQLEKACQGIIDDYLEKDFIEKVGPEESSNRVFYLPIFPVINPLKPGKTRMVWDAAAKSCGLSLNDFLMPGPDLLTPLPAVLLRFREYEVAVAADIESMFHQVVIREADRDAQRFLWRPQGATESLEYRMKRMTFGPSCSPTIAQFVKNTHAESFVHEYPEAVRAIKESHYVDDFLESYPTLAVARAVSGQVELINRTGGFPLKQWRSSHLEAIEQFGRHETDPKTFGETNGRLLGLGWCCSTDHFKFATQHILQLRDPPILSKRLILKGVMSVFDPLGFAAHVVIKGKIILREVVRTTKDWDEPVTPHLQQHWREWCDILPRLDMLNIPRWWGLDPSGPWELHTFVDASREAFAAAAYVRGRNADGEWKVRLVMAKTRVAPQRKLTIPRLELQAAVLGARLARTIRECLRGPLHRFVFWSDSRTVVAWIRSSDRRYSEFVAPRIDEILDNTMEKDWRWVPTAENVADDATRPNSNVEDDRWFEGPQFLTGNEDLWPAEEPVLEEDASVEELAPVLVAKQVLPCDLFPDASGFSSWDRFIRAAVLSLQALRSFVAALKREKRQSALLKRARLTRNEVKNWNLRAEEEVIRACQQQLFPDVIAKLQENPKYQVPRTHKLVKLMPFLDQTGILRVSGRLPAQFPRDVREPIILESGPWIATLLVRHYHTLFRHGNHQTVIDQIQRRFYIVGLRRLVRAVINECPRCRLLRPKQKDPVMGQLPKARVALTWQPFSYCGVDYFGPLEVVVGRRVEKRWVALFTCLTTRAIFLEVAYSLDTDQCLMCLRNLMNERDVVPVEIHSDNGTNFRAADKELQRFKWQFPSISWEFITPGASHMGGCWERMVQCVKRNLLAVAGPDPFTDPTLRCFLKECQWIVNCHPLTEICPEPGSEPALTPNDFLNLRCQARPHEGVGVGGDNATFLRKSWRRAQQLADHFWRRFSVEVIPLLNRRTRWFQEQEALKVDDVVMLPDDSRRGIWKKGRVAEVFPGKDQRVRTVRVQTQNGSYLRPVHRLAKLDG